MPGIPICVYRPNIKKFQVTLSRGKIFFSGGFGVISPSSTNTIATNTLTSTTSTHTLSSISCERVKSNDEKSDNITSHEKNEICIENEKKKLSFKDTTTSTTGKDPDTKENILNEKNEMENNEKNSETTKIVSNDNNIFLFLEEVIYLYERGLLKVMREINNKYDNEKEENLVPMLLPELFSLLEDHNICLAAYITYAYLRSQTFIVLRHCDRTIHNTDDDIAMEVNMHKEEDVIEKDELENKHTTFNIDEQHQENHHQQLPQQAQLNQSSLIIDNQVSKKLLEQKKMLNKRKKIQRNTMRKRVFNAEPPRMLYWNDDATSWKNDLVASNQNTITSFAFNSNNETTIINNNKSEDKQLQSETNIKDRKINNQRENDSIPLSFDVYKPNTNFRRSDPGLPHFHVAIMDFSAPSPSFHTLKQLISTCANIPLKLATVSDSGTVTMFSISDGDVPKIK